MDPIAKFIYIFLSKDAINSATIKYNFSNNTTFVKVFNDGNSLFDFIKKTIAPDFIRTNNNKYDYLNNYRCLKFLSDNFPGIIDFPKAYETENDIYELFKKIITKIIYDIDTTKIFDICKKIFSKYQISIKEKKDILTKEKFLTLIYLLYYHKKPKSVEIDDEEFDKFIQKIDYEKNNTKALQLFIDSTFFDEKYNFFVYVQIHMIFVSFRYEFNDPLVNYIFYTTNIKPYNKIMNNTSIYSFFNTQNYFYDLILSIGLISKDEIPQTIQKANSAKEKNLILLHHLHLSYPNTFSFDQSLDTDEDRFNVLKTVINFALNRFDCINCLENACNILNEYGFKINNIKDLFTPKAILSLFYISAYRKLPQFEVTIDNFDDELYEVISHFSNICFNLTSKFFINSTYFNSKYDFLIQIQISYILDIINVNDITDPILQTIFYFYPIQFNDYSIQKVSSFFSSGYHFPRFISILFNNCKTIPGVLNPIRNEDDAKNNNSFALQFLKKKVPNIKIAIQSVDTPQNQYEILKVILSDIIFDINEQFVLNECCRCFEFSPNFSSISYVLTLFQKIFQHTHKINEYNFIDFISNNKHICFFINNDFLFKRYYFLIYIQSQLFLRCDEKMQNPLIRFIRHAFMPKIPKFSGITIDSFFTDGYFSVFVYQVLKGPKPCLIYNDIDTKASLNYLINTYPEIIVNKSYETSQDKIELLKKIIIEIYYNINSDQFYDIINQYINQYNDNPCQQVLDFVSMYNFLNIKNIPLYNNNAASFDLFIDLLNIDSIFINSTFFTNEYMFLVYLQVFVLLDENDPIRIKICNPEPINKNENLSLKFESKTSKSKNYFYQNKYGPEFLVNENIQFRTKSKNNIFRQSNEYQCFLTLDSHYYLGSISALHSSSNAFYSDSSLDMHIKPLSIKQKKRQITSINFDENDDESISVESDSYENSQHEEVHHHFHKSSKNRKINVLESPQVIKDKLRSFQHRNEKALLKTINVFGTKCQLHFSKLYETVQNNSLSKFVVSFLDIKRDGFLSSDNKLIKFSNASNNDIINFIKKYTPQFGTLTFDFSNKQFDKSSAVLFYTTFFNILFLKTTKRKLFERCRSILNIKYNQKLEELKNEFFVLTNPLTFILLLQFVGNHKSSSKKSSNKHQLKILFKKMKIPRLISNEFLSDFSSQNKTPDAIYYQLQFIFDVFDSKPANRVIQFFISICSTIKQIKIPRPSDLLNNIKSKIATLEMTKEKASGAGQRTKISEFKSSWHKRKEEIKKELANSSAIYFLDYLDAYDLTVNSTFDQRLLKDYTIPILKNTLAKGDLKSTTIESSDKYWNSIDFDLKFDDGVFFENLNEPYEKSWNEKKIFIQSSVEKSSNKKEHEKKLKKNSDKKHNQKDNI